MLLVVDVGNSNITLGLFHGERLKADWRLETVSTRTRDEYGLLVEALLNSSGTPKTSVTGVIVGSVVPRLTPVMVSLAKVMFGRPPLVVGPGLKTGMPVRYSPPQDVGADRILNAIAAYQRFKSACIVVDFGTATTFDSISERGEYAGGAIAPGILLSMEALFERAAKLPRVDLVRPKRVVGESTVASIQAGAYFGYVALVDGLVERMKQEMGQTTVRVIATGGLAPVVAEDAKTLEFVDESLTLSGLQQVYALNAPADQHGATRPGGERAR